MLIKQHCGHSVCALLSDRCVHRCVVVCVKWRRVRLRLYGPRFFCGTGVHSTGRRLTLRWPYRSHTGQRSQSQIPRSWFHLQLDILMRRVFCWAVCTHQVWTCWCFLVCVCGSGFPLSSWRGDEEPEHKSRNAQICRFVHSLTPSAGYTALLLSFWHKNCTQSVK